MLLDNPQRWHDFLYAIPIVGGVLEFGKVPVDATGYAGCALISLGVIWIASNRFSIALREADYFTATDRKTEPEPIRETKSDPIPPAPFEGLKPIIRVDGKPHVAYPYTTQAVKINKELHIAVTLVRQNEKGEAFDLTEETWARNKVSPNGRKTKKFMSRSELNELKTKWETHGLICRLSPAKNAPYDAYDWNKIKDVARGRPLPR